MNLLFRRFKSNEVTCNFPCPRGGLIRSPCKKHQFYLSSAFASILVAYIISSDRRPSMKPAIEGMLVLQKRPPSVRISLCVTFSEPGISLWLSDTEFFLYFVFFQGNTNPLSEVKEQPLWTRCPQSKHCSRTNLKR